MFEQRARSKDWQLGLQMEYTPRNTPQHNHLAELAFAAIGNKGRAMLVRANVLWKYRFHLYREAFKTATDLDGLVMVTVNGKRATRYQHMFGSNPRWVKHLRLFGEAGTLKIATGTTAKLADRGVQCMMVGYAENHDGDVYLMWNPLTERVHVTQDVIWLKQMMFQKRVEEDVPCLLPEVEAALVEQSFQEAGAPEAEPAAEMDEVQEQETSDPEDEEEDEGAISQAEEPTQWATATTRYGRASRLPSRFRQEMNAAAITGSAAKNYYALLYEEEEDDEEPSKLACVGAGLGRGIENTTELHAMNYKAAMKTADKPKWDQAVEEEHDRMVKMGVWEAVPKNKVPKDAKVISTTWAMKKKSNGTFRARVNARGFMQVAGEHYNADSISSPVTNEATVRVVLVLSIIFKWTNELVDVKGAFLCGNFQDEKPIYMKVPEGFERHYQGDVLLLLRRTIYGLKQAARAFWRELMVALTDMGYSQSPADPCLYYCWTMTGLVIWLTWIDDCLIAGDEKGVKMVKEQIKGRFDCDDVGLLNEYVGYKIERDEKSIRFTQPVLLQSFEDELRCKAGKVMIPAEAGGVLVKQGESKHTTGVE